MLMDPVSHFLKMRQVRGCPTAVRVVPCLRAKAEGVGAGRRVPEGRSVIHTHRAQMCQQQSWASRPLFLWDNNK